jgi:hypothetical protein
VRLLPAFFWAGVLAIGFILGLMTAQDLHCLPADEVAVLDEARPAAAEVAPECHPERALEP